VYAVHLHPEFSWDNTARRLRLPDARGFRRLQGPPRLTRRRTDDGVFQSPSALAAGLASGGSLSSTPAGSGAADGEDIHAAAGDETWALLGSQVVAVAKGPDVSASPFQSLSRWLPRLLFLPCSRCPPAVRRAFRSRRRQEVVGGQWAVGNRLSRSVSVKALMHQSCHRACVRAACPVLPCAEQCPACSARLSRTPARSAPQRANCHVTSFAGDEVWMARFCPQRQGRSGVSRTFSGPAMAEMYRQVEPAAMRVAEPIRRSASAASDGMLAQGLNLMHVRGFIARVAGFWPPSCRRAPPINVRVAHAWLRARIGLGVAGRATPCCDD
jgi:hypothetical protein